MAWFKSSYEPGGSHHIKITDADFQDAQDLLKNDPELMDEASKRAKDADVKKYEAHDFPVSEIVGTFYFAYNFRQKKLGIAEKLWMGNAELGRKEIVEYDGYVKKLVEKDEYKSLARKESWDSKGLGGKLFSVASRAAARGIANAASGKSSDIRNYEKNYANYLSGDSNQAKVYLMGFANDFGGNDDGVCEVSEFLRQSYWVNEFVRYFRN